MIKKNSNGEEHIKQRENRDNAIQLMQSSSRQRKKGQDRK